MDERKELAECIFPEVKVTIAELETRFPTRNLKCESMVTRFAPSPTGFLHTGSLFTAMIASKMAKQSQGVFFVRLEDTDTKREISGSGVALLEQLKVFDIIPQEGYLGDYEKGQYGPYCQSKRAEIYKAVIKQMIIDGKAYPCFCSNDELEVMRTGQEKEKVIPGYYKEYAKCRKLTVTEQIKKIKQGDECVIRFMSNGDHNHKLAVHDLIRGDLELSENDQDIVIMKSDGLPTYHFAHVVDDHFMHTTYVTRGEEWLPSLPIHVELFNALGFSLPQYAHLPVIMKLDENGNRRKLSKRKDAEAAVSFFLKEGYPAAAFLEYLMTIANSNFEEWKINNPTLSMDDFILSFAKMSLDGALFDIGKLKYFAKEYLSKKKAKEIKNDALQYAHEYDESLEQLILRDENYFVEIMNIEREKENPRKDYEKFSDIFPSVKFFYDDYYDQLMVMSLPLNQFIDKQIICQLLQEFSNSLNIDVTEEEWFANLKLLGEKYGFAPQPKLYKKNPELYVGHIGDIAEILRIALTAAKQSPNLYYILKILGRERVVARINKTINLLQN